MAYPVSDFEVGSIMVKSLLKWNNSTLVHSSQSCKTQMAFHL